MYPIYIKKTRTGDGLSIDQFAKNFKSICLSHQEDNRASSFAFILYDFTNPEIKKVLDDKDYFNALDELSGNNLTIFYLHLNSDRNEKIKFLGEERIVNDLTKEINNFLIEEFQITSEIKSPTILFFQIKNKEIIDYFFCSLNEKTVEKSFLEIEKLVRKVAGVMKHIAPENMKNHQEIFNLIKQEIDSITTIKTVKSNFKKVYNFGKIILFIEKFISVFVP